MGENCSAKQPWRAEESIAGNAMALQALRELIIYPLVYSREASILGLKVITLYCLSLPLFDSDPFAETLKFCLLFFFLQWPRGLLLYGPPGTGKVLYNLYLSYHLSRCILLNQFHCIPLFKFVTLISCYFRGFNSLPPVYYLNERLYLSGFYHI